GETTAAGGWAPTRWRRHPPVTPYPQRNLPPGGREGAAEGACRVGTAGDDQPAEQGQGWTDPADHVVEKPSAPYISQVVRPRCRRPLGAMGAVMTSPPGGDRPRPRPGSGCLRPECRLGPCRSRPGRRRPAQEPRPAPWWY